jgi:hypothetical protein
MRRPAAASSNLPRRGTDLTASKADTAVEQKQRIL